MIRLTINSRGGRNIAFIQPLQTIKRERGMLSEVVSSIANGRQVETIR